jgi:archaellum biogenesis ATPase FlaH
VFIATVQLNFMSARKTTPTKKVTTKTLVEIPGLVNGKQLFLSPNEKRQYLLDGWLPRGILAALVGTSDVGKSMFARDLVLHIVLGRKKFIGKLLQPKHNRVLYVSTEDDTNEWVLRLKASICEPQESGKLDGLDILFSQGKKTFEKIHLYLKQHDTDLVVVDVATDLGIGNINDTDVVRNFLNPLKEMARVYNTTILILHHTGKRTQGIDKDNTIGSQAWTSAPRAVLMITKESSGYGRTPLRALTLVKGNFAREEEKNRPIPLVINDRLSFEPAPLTTAFELYTSTGKKQKKTEDPEIIGKVMELHNQGLTYVDIAAELKGTAHEVGKTTISQIIKENKSNDGETADAVAA